MADFPGKFGWGYDGVNLFAPTRLYGFPDDFRRFVDRAHAAGLGVILDVVYNHLGPDGNYLKEFAEDCCHRTLHDRLGRRDQFRRGERRARSRIFHRQRRLLDRQFHLDGLRLDATQNIYDLSDDHILAAVTRRARSSREGVRSSSSPKTSRGRLSSSGRKSRAVTELTRSGTTISITARWWR